MTLPADAPVPTTGSTSWSGPGSWPEEVEALTDVAREMASGRLLAADLTANTNSAIQTLTQSILNGGRVDAISLNRVGEQVVTIPPGRWVVTDPGVFMSGAIPADGRRSRGLVIQGSGRYTTEIVFAPTAAGYLFDNQDRVSRITLRDITFTGDNTNASFMNSVSNGGPQDMVCDRVVWRGTWNYGFLLTGTDVNSEFNFFSCSVLGTWGTFLHNTNVQALNHNFVACNIEPDTGDMLNYQVGGHINIWGGSWIGAKNNTAGTGTLIKLGPSSAAAVNRFVMTGVRVEHRSPTYKLIDSQWSGGTIAFTDVHDTGYQSDLANQPTYTRAVFSTSSSSAGNWPHVTFDRCRLYGKHQYITLAQNDNFRNDIVYRNCTIQGHSRFADFIITTLDATVSTRAAAVAPVKFEGCRSATNTSSTLVPDQTLNGHIGKNAPLEKRTVSVRNGFGTLPASGDAALTVTLPLNAVITGVRAFGRAGSSAGTNTGWSYILQTTETTPTVLFSKGGADTAAGQSTGFNLTTEPWFIADSDTKRALTLAASAANTSGSGTAAYFLVEYLA